MSMETNGLKQIRQETVYSFGSDLQSAEEFFNSQSNAKLSSPNHAVYEVIITTVLFDATEH